MEKKNADHVHARIAMTGACTFLNTLVLKRLAESPAVTQVHIFDIKAPDIVSPKFVFHRIDLTKDSASSEMASILIKHHITALIHGALFSGPTRKHGYHHEVESIGTYHVLNAAAEAGIKRLVVHSSTFVYGAHPQNPNFICENYGLKPRGPYFVKTRVDVENQIADFANTYTKTQVIVLRFAPILGPNSTNIRARYFMAGIVPKALGYDPLLQFIHEDDALQAQMLALKSSACGVFNIVGKGVLPLSTGIHLAGKLPVPFASSMCKTFFASGYLLRIWDLPADMVPFFQYLCVADGKKAARDLGFLAKYSSRQALKSMIESTRLRKIGFPTPSHTTLGEDKAYATIKGFQRIN